MDPGSEVLRFVLLFDNDFEVSAGSDETEGIPSGLVITNQQQYFLQFWNLLFIRFFNSCVTKLADGVLY